MNEYREHLLTYFSDGLPHSPVDLDREVLGIYRETITELMMYGPRWNRSPYFAELGKLVDEGFILATYDENGWLYTLNRG